MAKTASTIRANLVLERCIAVPEKVKDSISFESFIELCSAHLQA